MWGGDIVKRTRKVFILKICLIEAQNIILSQEWGNYEWGSTTHITRTGYPTFCNVPNGFVRLSRGEDGRLLDWEGVQSDTTIYILPPDSTDLPPGIHTINSLSKYQNQVNRLKKTIGRMVLHTDYSL